MESDPSEWHLPGAFEYRGVMYHSRIHKHIDIEMFDNWSPESSDIVIASYPKSGTTWIGSLLKRVLDSISDGPSTQMSLSYIEFFYEGSTLGHHRPDGLQILKTHMPYEYLKKKVEKENLKVIVMTRDPKDTITSYYHMHCHDHMGKFPGDFHDFYKLFKSKRLTYGDVFEWTAEWWRRQNLPNVLTIKYEDLHKDCTTELGRVCKFLGLDVGFKKMQEVVEECSFKKLSTNKEIYREIDEQTDDTTDGKLWFRKGVVGDWKNHFNQAELEEFDRLSRIYFEPIGLTFCD